MKVLLLMIALGFCAPVSGAEQSVSRVLGSIDIGANQSAGNLSSVNGAIEVGSNSTVAGIDTVNGHLRRGAGSSADSMTTVNGSVTLDADAKVKGAVSTVNGSLLLAPGVEVGGALSNVKGDVTVDGAHVVGELRTESGSVETRHGARLDAGIHVGNNRHNWGLFGRSTPRIVIGPDTVVGPLTFERKVTLYISDRALVNGKIEGAQAVRFSGEKPPN